MSVFGRHHSATSAPRLSGLTAFMLQPSRNQHLIPSYWHPRQAAWTTIHDGDVATTIGCLLIAGGRYTHSAWLRTASDTVSSLGTDP